MTRSMGDDEGRVQVQAPGVTPNAYLSRIDSVISEACRQFILHGYAQPDPFDSEGISIDWDGIAKIVSAFTRTTVGKLQFFMELELCPIHAIDYEICEDDRDPECQQLRDYLEGRLA